MAWLNACRHVVGVESVTISDEGSGADGKTLDLGGRSDTVVEAAVEVSTQEPSHRTWLTSTSSRGAVPRRCITQAATYVWCGDPDDADIEGILGVDIANDLTIVEVTRAMVRASASGIGKACHASRLEARTCQQTAERRSRRGAAPGTDAGARARPTGPEEKDARNPIVGTWLLAFLPLDPCPVPVLGRSLAALSLSPSAATELARTSCQPLPRSTSLPCDPQTRVL